MHYSIQISRCPSFTALLPLSPPLPFYFPSPLSHPTSNPHSYPLGNSSPKFPHPLHWTESKIGTLGGPAGQLARFGGCERQYVRVRCPNRWYTVGLHHIVDPNPKPQTLNLSSLPPPLSRCGWTAKANLPPPSSLSPPPPPPSFPPRY